MALGQALDLAGGDADRSLVARLKGGSYSVEGPLLIGAALAEGHPAASAALAAYGAPLGLAFQLLDDERDGEAVLESGRVAGLIAQARAGLGAPGLDPEAVGALRAMIDLVAAG
jgi:hypothetical protein